MADAARELVIRVWLIPFSTNVERVSLALGHKGVRAEQVLVDPGDRSEVVRVSGQDLVPVADFNGEIVADSLAILRRIEELHPEPPLWPPEPARRTEMDLFIDWFNRVWKVPPNAIAEMIEGDARDQLAIDAHAAEMTAALGAFESLLDGRPYLFGDTLSAADCIAFPFLKYAAMRDPADDDDLFHRVLEDYQRLDDGHPNLAAWIERLNAHPRGLEP
ncbi:MAG: glutathione S-transferase family protein [Thermoleophilaceae bacterium]